MFGPSLWPPGRQARPRPCLPAAGFSGDLCHVAGSGSVLEEAAPLLSQGQVSRGQALGFAAARGRRGPAEPGLPRASSAGRAISTGQLQRLAPLSPPAYRRGGLPRLSARPGFEEGFPLRCVQRLSRPHLATRRCGWRHNRYTRGASLPVLSYWGERLASLEHPRQIGTELSHDVLNPAHVPL